MSVIEKFEPKELGPKPWGIELLVAHTEHYTGKMLWMVAGEKGPLQYHERKDETFYLHSGKALIRYKTDDGTLCEVPMIPGESYHVPPMAVHQVEAQTDCTFFETSTPIFDDRKPA